jgi:hypothetical protein
MEINYTMIFVAAVAQFVLGAVWYSALFGKMWAKVMEMTHMSKEDMAKMQKQMTPAYVAQFVMSLVFVFVLAHFINMGKVADPGFSSYQLAFWIWLGFNLTVQVAATIWSQTKKKYWITQIAIASGYQLVSIMIATFILTM